MGILENVPGQHPISVGCRFRNVDSYPAWSSVLLAGQLLDCFLYETSPGSTTVKGIAEDAVHISDGVGTLLSSHFSIINKPVPYG